MPGWRRPSLAPSYSLLLWALIVGNQGPWKSLAFVLLPQLLPSASLLASQSLCTMAGSSSLDAVTSATVRISSDFCGGNIELVDVIDNEDTTSCQVQLRIRPDVYSELERKQHSQYFCFGATVHHLDDDGSPTKTVEFVLQNAAEASFPAAWKGTTVFYSYVCNCGYGCLVIAF
jgi:Cytosolic carboxypeptidase N-terminal domain